MKTSTVVTVITLLAGCSNMGSSGFGSMSGYSAGMTDSSASVPLTNDERIFRSYSSGQ